MFFLISFAIFSSSVFDTAPSGWNDQLSIINCQLSMITGHWTLDIDHWSFPERMFGARIAALTHFGREHPRRFPHVLGQRRVLLHELGRELVVESQHVVQHEHL